MRIFEFKDENNRLIDLKSVYTMRLEEGVVSTRYIIYLGIKLKEKPLAIYYPNYEKAIQDYRRLKEYYITYYSQEPEEQYITEEKITLKF